MLKFLVAPGNHRTALTTHVSNSTVDLLPWEESSDNSHASSGTLLPHQVSSTYNLSMLIIALLITENLAH